MRCGQIMSDKLIKWNSTLKLLAAALQISSPVFLFFSMVLETAHIFEIRDLRLKLTNQHLDDSLIPKYWRKVNHYIQCFCFHPVSWAFPSGEKCCLLSSRLSDFRLSIQCWQSVFSDYVHAQTPKRVSGLAKPRSAPKIITDFSLLLHPCLPNWTSYNLQSSGLKRWCESC